LKDPDAVDSEEEFYSAATDTKQKVELKEMVLVDNTEDAEYEEGRSRLEEIKKEMFEEEDTSSGPFVVDIEAENRDLIERELDEALAGDAKSDLDDRLKKAAEEAKAKGKKTVRTFDMLRKAINGDPEQRKKEQEEHKKKKEEEERAEKLKADQESAKKVQTSAP